MMVEKDSLGTEEDFRAIGLEEDEMRNFMSISG